jgi:hypothetical protein
VLFFESLDLGRGRAEKHGFKQRAEKGNAEGESHGEGKSSHLVYFEF